MASTVLPVTVFNVVRLQQNIYGQISDFDMLRMYPMGTQSSLDAATTSLQVAKNITDAGAMAGS